MWRKWGVRENGKVEVSKGKERRGRKVGRKKQVKRWKEGGEVSKWARGEKWRKEEETRKEEEWKEGGRREVGYITCVYCESYPLTRAQWSHDLTCTCPLSIDRERGRNWDMKKETAACMHGSQNLTKLSLLLMPRQALSIPVQNTIPYNIQIPSAIWLEFLNLRVIPQPTYVTGTVTLDTISSSYMTWYEAVNMYSKDLWSERTKFQTNGSPTSLVCTRSLVSVQTLLVLWRF